MIAGRGGAYALLGLAALLAALAVSSAWSGASRLAGGADERAEVERSARAFVEAYGTFHVEAPEDYRQRLIALSAGDLRRALSQARVDPVALAERRSSQIEVLSLAVTDFSDGAASVAVTALHTRRLLDPRTDARVEEAARQRVELTLAREDGRWLVTGVRLLAPDPHGN